MRSTFPFVASDGVELVVHTWLPDDGAPTRYAMLIVHGMAEHAARYDRLARALVARGWAVYAHDQRGHGRSAARDELTGVVPGGWTSMVRDVGELRTEVRKRHPGVPFALMGHSMGSFEVQQLLYEAPEGIDAVVLSGSNGRPGLLAQVGRVVARVERARLGQDGKSKLLESMSFGAFNKAFAPTRTEFDWISRDAAEVDAYVADPRCGFVCSTGLWVTFIDGLLQLSRPANIFRIRKSLPLYLFSGDRDPVGENGAGVRRLEAAYRRAGLTDVTLKLYPDARHEMLNETNREEVFADLFAWLDRAVPLKSL